ncbi:MAG: DUF4352 domain-containing protein [Myxococcales bacterium]|nr:DUF4352 domain-containing protein [Myxococcales bacterium]MCB9578075.1 DUF4352 domain-containing protein [Polyangiaceae bacterium]
MHIRSSSWTAFGCVVLIAGALLACKKKSSSTTGSTTTTAETPTTPVPTATTPPITNKVWNVGEAATAPDYKMTIDNVKECKVKYYFRPKKGNIKLGVEVSIEGTADKDVPVNPFYAKITDGEGYSYTSTFGGCEPDLKSVRIGKGEKAKGWVTFEVPEKASGLKLTYNPFIIGTAKQELKFDLGR